MSRIVVLFRLIRIKHWVKNFMIFIPVLFMGELLNRDRILPAVIAWLNFGFLASAIYVYNDLKDVENDRRHPRKKERPIASGEVKITTAKITFSLLLAISALMCWTCFENRCLLIILEISYVLINILYSSKLKHIPLADVTVLSCGYLIRLFIGGVVTDIDISSWVFLTVLSASYWLGFGKREKESQNFGKEGRTVLGRYPHDFLSKGTQTFSCMTMVFYALSCADKATAASKYGINLIWTVPVVILICLRYNYLLEESNCSGDPTEIFLEDKAIVIMAIIYVLLTGFLMSVKKSF